MNMSPNPKSTAAAELNLDDRLDCDNIGELTERPLTDPNRPSFITVIMRFFANIFVDCFRAIFE